MEGKKILYHIGDSVGIETIAKKGNLVQDNNCFYISSQDEKIALNQLSAVELIKINGLGSMVKLKNGVEIIFFTIPRLYIDIGTGFAIVNYFATRKAKRLLKLAMQSQQK